MKWVIVFFCPKFLKNTIVFEKHRFNQTKVNYEEKFVKSQIFGRNVWVQQ